MTQVGHCPHRLSDLRAWRLSTAGVVDRRSKHPVRPSSQPITATGRRLAAGAGKPMSEGYTIDGFRDEVAGIVVRYQGERGFRFHSASKAYTRSTVTCSLHRRPRSAPRATRAPRTARARTAHSRRRCREPSAPCGADLGAALDAHRGAAAWTHDCRKRIELAWPDRCSPGRHSVRPGERRPRSGVASAGSAMARPLFRALRTARRWRAARLGTERGRSAFQLECLVHEFFFVRTAAGLAARLAGTGLTNEAPDDRSPSQSLRPGVGACPCRLAIRRRPKTDAAQRLLRSDARALPGVQRGLRQALEGEDRRGRHHQAVARRLRQAGPRGDRRPGGRRRDPGARLRHRRHRTRRPS